MEEMICNGNFYHVCTDGLEQVTLLKDEDDFKTAWNYLALSAWRNGVSVVAFTLMSNHVHELLACKKAGQADKTIKLYKKLISTFLRRKYGLSQTLHRTRDCISVIDSIQYLKNCIAYILRNAHYLTQRAAKIPVMRDYSGTERVFLTSPMTKMLWREPMQSRSPKVPRTNS